jgi:hypothetical protein
MQTNSIDLGNSRCLRETTLNVEAVVCAYLTRPPRQLSLLAWHISLSGAEWSWMLTQLDLSTRVVCARQIVRLGRFFMYVYQVCLVNSRCLSEATIKDKIVVRTCILTDRDVIECGCNCGCEWLWVCYGCEWLWVWVVPLLPRRRLWVLVVWAVLFSKSHTPPTPPIYVPAYSCYLYESHWDNTLGWRHCPCILLKSV